MAETNLHQLVRLRALPVREAPERVDREAHTIFGVSCAQAVEALGHGLLLDRVTLDQLADHGNRAPKGIKSRFTHPGLSSDGLGKMLGRLKDFRVEDDKVLADLHLSALAFKSPDGNLGDYVMGLAEDEPEAFGMSVVVDGEAVWVLDDGYEVPVGDTRERPKRAVADKPALRIVQFVACDAVDEPAANRDGLFSAHLWATNKWAESAFGEIDNYLARQGVTVDKAFEVALRYFDARGVKLQKLEVGMAEEAEVAVAEETQVEAPPVEAQEETDVTQEEAAALQAQMAAKETALAEAEKRLAEIEGALAEANERIAAMEAEARSERFRALAAGWVGDTARHVDLLERLAGGGGEDGEAVRFYREQQDAVAAQVKTGSLLKELGHDQELAGGSAAEKLEGEAKRLMASDAALTYAQAIERAAARNPQLYTEHISEMRGR